MGVFWLMDSVVELNDLVEWEMDNQGMVTLADGFVYVNRNDHEGVLLWTG